MEPRTPSSTLPVSMQNGGVFEPLLTKDDAIISDSLNHASVIDGVRLCKAARYRYQKWGHGRSGGTITTSQK